jgi:predicted AAA+ superfamily ATPase
LRGSVADTGSVTAFQVQRSRATRVARGGRRAAPVEKWTRIRHFSVKNGLTYSRSLEPPSDKSFFLFGPRGRGKSSWLRRHFADAVYLDLLASEVYTELLASPQRLDAAVPRSYRGWVVLDEVQKVPALLDEVHRLIERRGLRFALSGSSARCCLHQQR